MPIKNVAGGWGPVVEAKTGAYAVTAQDCGKLFTNTGAGGSVTFTLPTSSVELVGWNADFVTTAAQPIVIASAPADTLVTDTDAASDTVTSATQTGQHFRVICVDASKMFIICNPSAATTATAVRAVTIAT